MSKKLLITTGVLLVLLTAVISYEITALHLLQNQKASEKVTETTSYYEDEGTTVAVSDDQKVLPADSTRLSRITPSTRIVYQYYYTLDDKLVTNECEPPYYLINMTRSQLEAYYEDWQLISFAQEKVVLRQSIQERNTKGYYIVKAYDGKLAVFFDYTEDLSAAFQEAIALGQYKEDESERFFEAFMAQNKDQYLREIVDASISVLSEEEQAKLQEGILVYGEDELIRLLENYTS